MSNPAIVLMTDPARCSLGDVHYLVQALLEMQQMGGNAAPQAFCDHPAAARDFVAAYTHAYPQLVLQDEEIPTPDHLHSLITNGQIGAFARPPDPTPDVEALNGPVRPGEHNGMNPIVVLTLGSSQVLIDALKQSPGVKENIRLIDIGEDSADSTPVSIADAVAVHGLEADSWQHDGSPADRLELDDIAGPAATDPASLAPRHDPMNLDVVETDTAPGGVPPVHDHEGSQDTVVAPEPSAAAAQPQQAVVEPSATLQGTGPAVATEAPLEAASQVDPAWQSAAPPVAASGPSVVIDVPAPQGAAPDVGGDEQAEQETPSSDDEGDKDDHADDEGDADQEDDPDHEDGGEQVAHGADDDDDVEYPPVGSLVASADVLYPPLDRGGTFGALHELATAILDDEMVDPDMAFEMLEVQRDDGLPAHAREETILTVHSGDNVVTIEGFYGGLDQDDEDTPADSGMTPPVHDSDL